MFGIVFEQTFILFVLIMLGVALAKSKILNDGSVKSLTDIVLYAVTPAIIIKSFARERSAETLNLLVVGFVASMIIFAGYIIISSFLFSKAKEDERAVLRFGAVFPNCGFMALPLLQALIGDDGVLVGAAFVASFNIYTWTYGVLIMSGNGKNMSLKKIVFNPGIIGVTAGFIIFCFSIRLPKVIMEPISYMAALNTPVPMIIIGYNIYKTNLLKVLTNWRSIAATVIRLLAFPLITVGVLKLCGIQGDLLTSMAICSAAPTAATTTMFAVKFDRATDISVNLVALSTLLSLITIPLIVTIVN